MLQVLPNGIHPPDVSIESDSTSIPSMVEGWIIKILLLYCIPMFFLTIAIIWTYA